jgi:hypothetical protein
MNRPKMSMPKTFLDLSIDDKTQFLTLYNAFKSSDKQDDRAKTSWTFLCFVYKHLGSDMLSYFTDQMFDGDDAKRVIISMVRRTADLSSLDH